MSRFILYRDHSEMSRPLAVQTVEQMQEYLRGWLTPGATRGVLMVVEYVEDGAQRRYSVLGRGRNVVLSLREEVKP
jgi:hypothetical protein